MRRSWRIQNAVVDARNNFSEKMQNRRPLRKGDVVTCPEFIAGEKDEKGRVWCGRQLDLYKLYERHGFTGDPDPKKIPQITGKETRSVELSTSERVEIASRSGRDPGTVRKVLRYNAFDRTRATAKFVVVKTESNEWTGGSDQGGPAWTQTASSLVPDGAGEQIITAKRLKLNSEYDPAGEIIHFYWRDSGSLHVHAHFGFKVIGRMKEIVKFK